MAGQAAAYVNSLTCLLLPDTWVKHDFNLLGLPIPCDYFQHEAYSLCYSFFFDLQSFSAASLPSFLSKWITQNQCCDYLANKSRVITIYNFLLVPRPYFLHSLLLPTIIMQVKLTLILMVVSPFRQCYGTSVFKCA